jgi:colanic acid biosynthesis glycosyl transferase WcaI
MKILLYGLNYSPEVTGIGKYTSEMAEYLAGKGHSVRVITAPPYYPEWRVHGGFSAWKFKHESSGAHHPLVIRCPIWVPRQPGGVTRLLHLASFALSSLPVSLSQIFWRPNLVMVIAPAFFCAPGGALTARLCGAKAWLHIQDFEVDAAFSLGILKSEWLRGLVTRVERFVMRRFDRVSTISPLMLQRLSHKGIAVNRQRLFPNWVDTSLIHPLETRSPFRKTMDIPDDAVVVLYSGNMGAKQGLGLLLDAAAMVATSKTIHFLLCGDGVERASLEQKYAHLGNVRWIDLQPIEALNHLLNAADIHALPQRADAADLVLPSKLTGMMASGRPVIAAAAPGTEIANTVDGAGIVVAPGDVHAFSEAIERLAADAELRRKLGGVARERAVASMGKETILARFESELRAEVSTPT